MSNKSNYFGAMARRIDWREAFARQLRKQPQNGSTFELTSFYQRQAAKRGIEATGTVTLPSYAFRAGSADDFQAGSGDGSGFVGTLAATAIGGLRPRDILDELGAVRLTSSGSSVSVPVFQSGSISTTAEGSTASAAGLEADAVTLSPQRAQATVTLSNMLLEQSSNEAIGNTVAELQRMAAKEVERKAFTAIVDAAFAASSGSTTNTGASLTYTVLRALEEGVLANGADDRAIKIVAGAAAGAAVSDEERTTAPVIDYPSRTVFGYNYFVSNSVTEPAATSDSSPRPVAIVGDFSQGLTVADFGTVDVLIDPFTNAASSQTNVTVTTYYGVAVTNAEAFSVYRKADTP